ncbi:MAG: Branched-chain amino acid transport system permease protein LivM [Candidatus Bipolaricaulis sibiricus]|uniref:Branched-chain amino acid transport system permease protein LivM n=1 Tax=Bipolaricaulis sibiricus TaxID=2501609 RepID=A0A410FV87_BIPS1|nr:MAG: Branched-chain amino acid transport system permease protein LivM [Candidatus Bipolaricaulis sibiricus]
MYYARYLLRYLRNEVLVLPSRVIVLVFVASLLAFPLMSQDPNLLRMLIVTALFSLYAVSWDLLSGYTGQISLGHALFFGLGAYASALLSSHLDLPPYVTIPAGATVATLAGLLVGVPCLRLRKHYLALATLAFPIMLTGLVLAFPGFSGGEGGIWRIARLTATRVAEYYLIMGVMLGAVFALWKIVGSRVGLIFHSIREDETAARALGINTVRYKLLAFALSGFTAGVAGALYAHSSAARIVAPGVVLSLFMSFQPVIWTIFGGVATLYGPISGVFVLYPLLDTLNIVIPKYRMLVFALLVLLILRFMPHGISIWIRDTIERVCPSCRVRNAALRHACRACGTELRAARS